MQKSIWTFQKPSKILNHSTKITTKIQKNSKDLTLCSWWHWIARTSSAIWSIIVRKFTKEILLQMMIRLKVTQLLTNNRAYVFRSLLKDWPEVLFLCLFSEKILNKSRNQYLVKFQRDQLMVDIRHSILTIWKNT